MTDSIKTMDQDIRHLEIDFPAQMDSDLSEPFVKVTYDPTPEDLKRAEDTMGVLVAVYLYDHIPEDLPTHEEFSKKFIEDHKLWASTHLNILTYYHGNLEITDMAIFRESVLSSIYQQLVQPKTLEDLPHGFTRSIPKMSEDA